MINNQNQITKFINDSYDAVVKGNIPGMPSAEELAEEYLKAHPSRLKAANELIKWQCIKTALSGLASGFPGGLTLPFALAADIACTYIINVRLVCALAAMAGLNLRNDKVRTLVYITLTGEAVKKKYLHPMGATAAETIAKKLINMGCSKKTAGRALPLVGGLIGAVIDSTTTASIGAAAIKAFLPEENAEFEHLIQAA